MGKNPAFQFYPSDWSRDLEEHPLEIEGAWIRICCKLWWEEERGKATKNLAQWARILREKEKKTFEIISYLLNQKLANVVIGDQGITIESRRMVKDEYIRNIRASAGSKGGNPALKQNKDNAVCLSKKNKQNPTPSVFCLLSSSSSSKKEINKKILYPEFVYLAEDEYEKLIAQFGEHGTKERIDRLNIYLGSTGKKYKSHYYTILNWERRNGNGTHRSNTQRGNTQVPKGDTGSGKYQGIGEVLD